MKIALLTFENRKDLDFYKDFAKINQSYCQSRNIDYIQLSEYNQDLPEYWIKVWLLRELIDKYDYVMWLDSDAVIRNFDFDIVEYFKDKPNHIMSVSADPGFFNVEANAGVILVRKGSEQMLDEWKSMYNPSSWYKSNGRWKCNGKWAGDDYEQGCMNTLIRGKWKHRIFVEPWEVFSNVCYWKQCNVIHVCGRWKRYYPEVVDIISKNYNLGLHCYEETQHPSIVPILCLLLVILFILKNARIL